MESGSQQKSLALHAGSAIYRQLNMLRSANETLLRETDENRLLKTICDIIVHTGGYKLAWVGRILHDEHKSVVPQAYSGFDAGYIEQLKLTWADGPRGQGPAGTSIRTGLPVASSNIQTDSYMNPWREAAIKRGFNSCISYPLKDSGKVFGNLAIYHSDSDAFSKEEECLLLGELADNLAYGIVTLRSRAERDRALEEANKSRELMQLIADSIPALIAYINKEQKYEFVNAHYCKHYKLEREKIVGKSVSNIVGEKLYERVIPFVRQTLAGESPAYYTDVPDQNGQVRNLKVHHFPYIGPDGKVLGLFNYVTDITEFKRAENEIKFARDRLEAVMEPIPADITVIDRDSGEILFSNRQAQTSFGVLNGKKCWSAFKGAGTRCGTCNLKIDPPDGVYLTELTSNEVFSEKNAKWYEHLAQPIEWEKGRQGVLYIRRDITRIKQAHAEQDDYREKLRHADKMKSLGMLVSSVAHEINNPMMYVLMNAATVEKIWDEIEKLLDSLPDRPETIAGIPFDTAVLEMSRLLSGIKDGGSRVTAIIKRLKEFAKPVNSRIRIDFNVNDSVERAIEMTRTLIRHNTKSFELNLTKPLPQCQGTPSEIEQVLVNLITNACHAMEAANGIMQISTAHAPDLRSVSVTVKDNGSGITPENIDKIPESPFFTTKPDQGGTGLGLYVCRGILSEHGGNLEISSPGVNQGTSVTFWLPIAE